MIVALVGKTCSGKTTLESRLVELGFKRVISYTTRTPRVGEIDGVHYHFVSQKEFEKMVAQKQMVEWKRFDDNLYGTLKSSEWGEKWTKGVSTAHVVVLEPVGANSLRNYCVTNDIPYAIAFVKCSTEKISERFIDRVMSAESAASSQRRLQTMIEEESSWPPSFLLPDVTLDSTGSTSVKLADQLISQLSEVGKTYKRG